MISMGNGQPAKRKTGCDGEPWLVGRHQHEIPPSHVAVQALSRPRNVQPPSPNFAVPHFLQPVDYFQYAESEIHTESSLSSCKNGLACFAFFVAILAGLAVVMGR